MTDQADSTWLSRFPQSRVEKKNQSYSLNYYCLFSALQRTWWRPGILQDTHPIWKWPMISTKILLASVRDDRVRALPNSKSAGPGWALWGCLKQWTYGHNNSPGAWYQPHALRTKRAFRETHIKSKRALMPQKTFRKPESDFCRQEVRSLLVVLNFWSVKLETRVRRRAFVCIRNRQITMIYDWRFGCLSSCLHKPKLPWPVIDQIMDC